MTDHEVEFARPEVHLVGATMFFPPPGAQWPSGQQRGEELVHFAGRACYQSWDRRNPATAATPGYIASILSKRHYSVLEHASATFYVTGVSRALTHELIRHRHLSFSELSQRFVDTGSAPLVVPPIFGSDREVEQIFIELGEKLHEAYDRLADLAFRAVGDDESLVRRRKRAREAARAVLPSATETRIVVTGNIRAWRHFIDIRATADADREICDLAIEILRQLIRVYPASFADYEFTEEPDGRTTAESRLAERS